MRDIDRLKRKVNWVNVVWVSAFLVLSVVCRIPPALISWALIELFVVAGLLASYRQQAP